ncbi:unnamed protein product [Microthlaspi erraticum]|uniref:Uncharacterized protein n=1 Tax=Microthlaspi erraticum TaxID=1685480 RepID=A0A6D2IW47_9BRAS|nr:unnamed protein product [Microthlaspi erraticum]
MDSITVKRLQHHRDVSPHGNLRPGDSDVQPFPFPKQSFDFSLHAKSENAYPLYISSLSQSMNHRLRIQVKDSSSTWFVNPNQTRELNLPTRLHLLQKSQLHLERWGW